MLYGDFENVLPPPDGFPAPPPRRFEDHHYAICHTCHQPYNHLGAKSKTCLVCLNRLRVKAEVGVPLFDHH